MSVGPSQISDKTETATSIPCTPPITGRRGLPTVLTFTDRGRMLRLGLARFRPTQRVSQFRIPRAGRPFMPPTTGGAVGIPLLRLVTSSASPIPRAHTQLLHQEPFRSPSPRPARLRQNTCSLQVMVVANGCDTPRSADRKESEMRSGKSVAVQDRSPVSDTD